MPSWRVAAAAHSGEPVVTPIPQGLEEGRAAQGEGPLGRGKGGALADLEFYFPT